MPAENKAHRTKGRASRAQDKGKGQRPQKEEGEEREHRRKLVQNKSNQKLRQKGQPRIRARTTYGQKGKGRQGQRRSMDQRATGSTTPDRERTDSRQRKDQ